CIPRSHQRSGQLMRDRCRVFGEPAPLFSFPTAGEGTVQSSKVLLIFSPWGMQGRDAPECDRRCASGRATSSGPRGSFAVTPMNRTLLMVGLAAVAFAAAYGATKLWHAPPHGPPGMVWVPGGEFTMGTDADLGWPDEKPAHRVRVDGFSIDATEVTK